MQKTSNAPTSQVQITNILIDGATGYIGSHLVSALENFNQTSIKLRCLVREKADDTDTNFLQTQGAKIFKSDLVRTDLVKTDLERNRKILEEAFSGVDVACHLIGSIAPKRGETSASLHVEQTERFVQYCRESNVKKIIMVSACGAAPEAASDYHRTKWQAEQIIRNSGLPAIILRPSLLIGKTVGRRNSKLITRLETLIRNKKFVPLIAGGKNKVQPLFIDDLIAALITCMFHLQANSGNAVSVFELGGPQILPLRELTQLLMKTIGTERPILDLPIPIAKVIASICETLQEVPLISRDQIRLSQKDNICSDNQIQALIKQVPASVAKSLQSYIA